MPNPVRFTDDTRCFGTSFWIDSELECTFSGTLDTVYATVAISENVFARRRRNLIEDLMGRSLDQTRGRELQVSQIIPVEAIINLLFTNVTSPDSLRPATGSIEYRVQTSKGYTIEAYTEDLEVVNTKAGQLLSQYAGVSPAYFEKDAITNYTVAFSPINYEQNMKIVVVVPEQITFNETIKCIGLDGTDTKDLTIDVTMYN